MRDLLILGLLAVAGVILVARLLWPRTRRKIGPDNNWEQRLNEDFPSLHDESVAPFDNIERGFGVAFGTKGRE